MRQPKETMIKKLSHLPKLAAVGLGLLFSVLAASNAVAGAGAEYWAQRGNDTMARAEAVKPAPAPAPAACCAPASCCAPANCCEHACTKCAEGAAKAST